MNERWEKARFFHLYRRKPRGVIVASSLWAYALREKETAAASIQQAETAGPAAGMFSRTGRNAAGVFGV